MNRRYDSEGWQSAEVERMAKILNQKSLQRSYQSYKTAKTCHKLVQLIFTMESCLHEIQASCGFTVTCDLGDTTEIERRLSLARMNSKITLQPMNPFSQVSF